MSRKKLCFVIQPFDGGKYDKRYEDVFEPAIKEAGFRAYRVDRDPEVEIPIESIEKKIREADVCLADISEDNPNVWYEVGYARAANRHLVLVACKADRQRFPFDVQHRRVILYGADSSSDFQQLRAEISERLEAISKRNVAAPSTPAPAEVERQSGGPPLEVVDVTIGVVERGPWWRFAWRITLRNDQAGKQRYTGRVNLVDSRGLAVSSSSIHTGSIGAHRVCELDGRDLVREAEARSLERAEVVIEASGEIIRVKVPVEGLNTPGSGEAVLEPWG